jgi:hypothetical protein
MQVSLGRRFAVEEQSNAKGLTRDAELKVVILDLFTLYFMHECEVYSGYLLKSRRLLDS